MPSAYMGSTLAEDGEQDSEATHIVQNGWKNWKRVFGGKWGISQSTGKQAEEEYWACDDKRGVMRLKDSDENESNAKEERKA